MAVSVRITSEALEQAGKLDEPIYSRIQKAIERLKNWPRVSGAKATTGSNFGWKGKP